MARLLLELSKPEFPKIGDLVESPDGEFNVAKGPFTFSINEPLILANIPSHIFPTTVFESGTDYFESLALQHMSHFLFQCNNAIADEADCHKKFVSRCLFQMLVQQTHFGYNHGPFCLFCDDFRLSNVLIDVETVSISVTIDWGFTYVAPVEFSYVAP